MLRAIDFKYLLLWGYSRQVIELHERLRLDDPDARESSVGVLVLRTARSDRSARRSKLRRRWDWRGLKNRQSEERLGNLSNCYAALGETARAIEHHEQALAIAREIGNKLREELWLRRLALLTGESGELSP
ncbi:MAG: tetratricopeptide repeat protein [Chloroflexia bacterium]